MPLREHLMVIFTEVPEHHLDTQIPVQQLTASTLDLVVFCHDFSSNDLIRVDEGLQERLQEVQHLLTPV